MKRAHPRRTRRLRLGATIFVVVALVSPPPAGATINTATVTGGTASINLTPVLTIPLDGSGSTCTSTLSATYDITAQNSDWTFTTALSGTVHFTYSGNPYVLTFTGTGTGTIGAPGGSPVTYAWTQTMNITGASIKSTSSCTPTTTKCTAISVSTLTLTGTLSSPGIGGETVVATSVATLSGSRTISAFGCTAPFSALNGKTLTITNMAVTF